MVASGRGCSHWADARWGMYRGRRLWHLWVRDNAGGLWDSSPAPRGISQPQPFLEPLPVPSRVREQGNTTQHPSTQPATRATKPNTIVACSGTPKTTSNSALRGPSPKAAGPRPGSGTGGLGDRRSEPGGRGARDTHFTPCYGRYDRWGKGRVFCEGVRTLQWWFLMCVTCSDNGIKRVMLVLLVRWRM